MDISTENHPDGFASGQNPRASQTGLLTPLGRIEALQARSLDDAKPAACAVSLMVNAGTGRHRRRSTGRGSAAAPPLPPFCF